MSVRPGRSAPGPGSTGACATGSDDADAAISAGEAGAAASAAGAATADRALPAAAPARAVRAVLQLSENFRCGHLCPLRKTHDRMIVRGVRLPSSPAPQLSGSPVLRFPGSGLRLGSGCSAVFRDVLAGGDHLSCSARTSGSCGWWTISPAGCGAGSGLPSRGGEFCAGLDLTGGVVGGWLWVPACAPDAAVVGWIRPPLVCGCRPWPHPGSGLRGVRSRVRARACARDGTGARAAASRPVRRGVGSSPRRRRCRGCRGDRLDRP